MLRCIETCNRSSGGGRRCKIRMASKWYSGIKGLSPRIWMPNIPLVILNGGGKTVGDTFAVKMPPSMTKIELRNYLETLYGLDVLKVNTLNVRTKFKRVRGPGRVKVIPRYKKAYVTVAPSDVSREMAARLQKMRPIKKRRLPTPEEARAAMVEQPQYVKDVLKRLDAE